MRRWFLATALACTVTALAVTILIAASSDEPSDKPHYNKAGELLRPENYREWIFLSAGLGMNYSPAPGSSRHVHECVRSSAGVQGISQITRVAGQNHVCGRGTWSSNQGVNQ